MDKRWLGGAANPSRVVEPLPTRNAKVKGARKRWGKIRREGGRDRGPSRSPEIEMERQPDANHHEGVSCQEKRERKKAPPKNVRSRRAKQRDNVDAGGWGGTVGRYRHGKVGKDQLRDP